MATTELYYNTLKDKDQLDRSNPRTRASSGLSSSDHQYKNFLSGIKPKPRVKSNSDVTSTKQESKSFVESAARTQSVAESNRVNRNRNSNAGLKKKSEKEEQEEEAKAKAHKALYEQFSSVPHSKKVEASNKENKVYQNESASIKSSSEVDFTTLKQVQSESFGSVGRLRSLFDKNAADNAKPVQFRKNVSKKNDRPLSTGYIYQENKTEVSGIYEKQNSQEQRKSLDVDSLLSSEPVVNDNNDTNNDTGPTKKSPRKSSNSEFENFEDYIVPTGTKKIDVRSILAPVDTEKDDAVTMKIEKNEASNIRTKELDIQQILEIERMKRTQDDVSIEKRFNIKRRSLKERLSLLAAEDNDPFASMSSNNDNEGSKVSQQVLKHEKMEMAEDAIEPVHITDVKEENLSDLLDDKPDVNEPYKSAVERYDEFITEQDVSNDFYSPTSPIDTNFGIKQKPLPSTDLNQNFVDTKSNKKLEKTANANTDSDSANLMDSILQHMEKTDTSKSIGKDYISLLRSSSLTEADQEKPAVENRGYAPEVLPRLSKQLAHNHTTPVTPPVSEDEVTLSFQSSIKPAGSDTSDVNTSRATTECESEYTDTCSSSDEFQLPPPPAKSNLARDKSREGLRVIFRQEKLHDVIYTYGPTEYDRANADIDPIASSAEWELEKRVDNMDIFSVDLQKDERGLGLSIIGLGVGTESGVEKLGIFVKTLTEGGASQKDGRIQVNDQILEVNGVSLVGVTQYFAAQTLKGTNGIVRFLMGREKSRRRSYAPGAPLSNSPEMQKHVEEINKVLQQVEELEERAANSESTLDDVRDELLKAEERAHEAERQLQETKEQLKAVTESPFVGNQRKLKNEIKKKGGNKEKVDELQRNLKDVSNRLSASEENLLMLTSVKDNKDRELQELYELVEDHATNKKQVEESNHSLRNELNSKSDLINQLQAENGKMQLLLDEQKKLYVEEQTKFQNIEAQHIGKVAEEEEELKSKFFELENINESLREEVKRLQEQLKANKKLSVENESLKQSVLELSANQQKLAFTEEKLKESERLNGELKLEVETLTAKNEYLQSLITKLDISHGQTSAEKNDLEQQFKVKAEQDLKEKEELDKKIQELESRLTSSKPKYFSKIVAEEVSIKTELDVESTPDKFDKDTPVLPKREYVNINIAYPPMISRDSKPSDSKPVSPTSVESFNLEVFPVDTKISETANIQSSELIEEVIINDVETENPTINFNTKLSNSLSNSSIINPITKPPRGHFIDVDEDFVIVPTPTEETKEIITIVKENNFEQLEPSIDVTSLSTDADRKTPEVEVTTEHKFILENSSLVQQVSDSIITSAVTEASSPGVKKKSLENDVNKSVNSDKEKIKKDMHSKYLQESSKPLSPTLISIPDSIEFDNLTEDTVDNDSDSDEGQFQLIAEDIQDEQSTPDTLSKQSVEIETAKTSETDRSSFFQALNNEPNFNSWLDDEWKRLDSNTREQQAELIAAQVTARSPAKRKSSISSGSSDDENDEKVEEEEKKKDENWSRTQSIKIDSSYFEKSTLQDSFDNEMSILDEDQEIRDIDATDVGIVKSTSFDSAIPATQVLDNKIALEKRQLMKRDEKRKPTHGARGQLAEEIDTFQISTLQRNKKASVSTPNLLKNAASEPNLLQVSNSSGTIDKPEKQKHKFGFHIPKVFKKGKINAKKSLPDDVVSTSSTDEHNKPAEPSPPVIERKANSSQITVIAPKTLEVEATPPQMSSPVIADAEIVPIDQRTESLSQENANDAATEEAVVPFATKELLMENVWKESVEEEPRKQSISLSVEAAPPQVPATVDVQSDAPAAALDDVEIKLLPSPSSNASPMPSKSSTMTEPKQNETYNERGVDVGTMENGHAEEENITHWTRRAASDWDVRQVGLWLVEMNLSQYVNNFKSHNVDGQVLLRADGNRLKEYGVTDGDHRAEIKKRIKEFRQKLGKDSFNKGKSKDHKSARDKLQFWKGKYKVPH